MRWVNRAGWGLLFYLTMCASPVHAGVPQNVPPTDDPLLGQFLHSLFDHLNTLECITKDPNGSVLGTHGELLCATFSGLDHACMNTGTGPAKTTDWTCFSGITLPGQAAITIESPLDSDNFFFFRPSQDITVTAIDCIVENATSAIITLQKCDGDGNNCTPVEAAMTCTVMNTIASGAIDSPIITADSWVRLDVGAISGTPGQVAVSVTYQ